MLLRLINDILEISTMDGNAIVITPEDVDFAQVFDDICESLQQRIQNPDVQFIKDNPYPTIQLSVDPRRIQQVITNFVTNAIKYTQKGHIKVGYEVTPTASATPATLYIYCEDTGAGIPKEKQGTVFDRFVKLNDYIQGTGLGLSICKAIAARCGGQIGVESEGEGHGSTFWIRIPL
jgi:signal transduction histidine kinase